MGDSEADTSAGHRIVGESDRQLLAATLSLLGTDGLQGKYTLTYDSKIKIWKDDGAGGFTEIVSDVESEEMTITGSEERIDLWIEGITESSTARDVEIRASFTPTGDPPSDQEDVVNLTVVSLDVDIDSDNDGDLERDSWEEELEEHEFALGSLVEVGGFNRAVIDMPGVQGLENATITIDYPGFEAGIVRVWTDVDRTKQLISGHAYTLSELNVTGDSFDVYIEGVSDSAGHETLVGWTGLSKPMDFMTVTLNAGNVTITDKVQYLVSTKESFVQELANNNVQEPAKKNELRSALASDLVYDQMSFRRYALERLDNQELEEVGIDADTIGWLNENGDFPSTGRPSGFKASLYRDYAASEANTFIFSFAGTDLPELDDWMTNFAQGIRAGAGSYTVAARAGYEVKRGLTEELGNSHSVTVAGHSLGGGLRVPRRFMANWKGTFLMLPDCTLVQSNTLIM